MTFSPTASGQSIGSPLHALGAPPLAATAMLMTSPTLAVGVIVALVAALSTTAV
jgi:hypothetical protein